MICTRVLVTSDISIIIHFTTLYCYNTQCTLQVHCVLCVYVQSQTYARTAYSNPHFIPFRIFLLFSPSTPPLNININILQHPCASAPPNLSPGFSFRPSPSLSPPSRWVAPSTRRCTPRSSSSAPRKMTRCVTVTVTVTVYFVIFPFPFH